MAVKQLYSFPDVGKPFRKKKEEVWFKWLSEFAEFSPALEKITHFSK